MALTAATTRVLSTLECADVHSASAHSGDSNMLTPCLWCHHLPDDHVRTRTERYCMRCDCRYYAHAKPKLAANRLVGILRRRKN